MITPDFLLTSEFSRKLYHQYAAPQPIFDYHNHLSPQQIAEDHHFANLHEAWLAGDHYKWRAMRVNGIEERLITGDADPKAKFRAFAKTVPATLRNPLFHWSHLELARYFDEFELLSERNADRIYDSASAKLQEPGMGTQGLLAQQKVVMVCTTDDPLDSLEYHAAFAKTRPADALRMLPAFRPDKALQAQNLGWRTYLDRLGELTGLPIHTYENLLAALEQRMDHFAAHGCMLSDHGLTHVPVANYDRSVADRLLRGNADVNGDASALSKADAETFLVTLLTDLGRAYARRGWVMQLHLGAQRNNNRRAERELGPDTGYDSIGDFPQAQGLAALLDGLNDNDELPKTILYNLNPADNHVFATMAGNFCGGGTVAKVQWGAAWWFLDQYDGMREQLNVLSSVGLLSRFMGMLTDSRSFLSFPRHEYFRRLLCEMIGEDVAKGKLPNDEAWMGELVKDVSYGNARAWFGGDQLLKC